MLVIPSVIAYTTLVCGILAVLLKASVDKARSRKASQSPFPPGPPSHFLYGNFYNAPKKRQHLVYAEWSERYSSDVVSWGVPGLPRTVVVNSAKAAKALFEVHSKNYSDRPHNILIELTGWDFNTGLLPYSDTWRAHRRIVQQNFRPNAVTALYPIIASNIKLLLGTILKDPNNLFNQIKEYTGTLPLDIAYGQKLSAQNQLQDLIPKVEQAVVYLSEILLPGANLVNVFPILRYLPPWVIGVRQFNKYTAACLKLTRELRDRPFEVVKKDIMGSGSVEASVLATILEENNRKTSEDRVDEIHIKGAVATSYVAAVDTSMSAISGAILALILHPHVQKHAQEELDRVVGRNRLPEFSDQDQLPYVTAICRESLRWGVTVPLGVSHAALEDDFYEGYFIPKGSVVVGNQWAILHDPETYQSPDKFLPERFLLKDGRLNNNIDSIAAFGFGRRICPGRYLASASLWLVVASVLSQFDILKAKDEEGYEIKPSAEWSDTGVSHIAIILIFPSYPIWFAVSFCASYYFTDRVWTLVSLLRTLL